MNPWENVIKNLEAMKTKLPRIPTDGPTPGDLADAIDLMFARNAAVDDLHDARWELRHAKFEVRRLEALDLAYAQSESPSTSEGLDDFTQSRRNVEAMLDFHRQEVKALTAQIATIELKAKMAQAQWEVFDNMRALRREGDAFWNGLDATIAELERRAKPVEPKP